MTVLDTSEGYRLIWIELLASDELYSCMNYDLTLVVMAAGMGSRYGGLKQMEGFGPNDETLLEYSLYDAIRAGFNRAVFVIRNDIESAFHELIMSRFSNQIDCTCVFQERDCLPEGHQPPVDRTKPWGTGHAVLVSKDAVKTPFAVINADDAYGRDAFEQLAGFLKSVDPARSHYALCGFQLGKTLSENGTVSRGICDVSEDSTLVSVTEHTKIDADCVSLTESGKVTLRPENLVSMNLWGFTPAVFGSLQEQFIAFLNVHGQELKSEFYLPAAIDADVKGGRAVVTVLPTSSSWIGVTYPEDKATASAAVKSMLAMGCYPERLWC